MGAIKSYYDLLNTTPAYKKFIESYGGQINSWVDIPPMSKNNYVKKYPVRELHKDGIIPIGGGSQTDTSTGTSGTPTIWYRSKNELDYIQNMLILTADIVVGFNTDIYLINMFALGKYATGMTVSRCLRDRFSVFNCGPDFDAAIRFIIATEKEREKPGTYIVAGYPPHMLEFVDLATQQGIDFSKISLFIVCGGESMSIHTRQNIEKYGVKLVISTYGASDLDINVAGQNIFDKVLGDVIKKDPSLLVDLAGKSVINKGTPAVFHFNPLYYYIENDLDGNLYFTSLNDKRSSGRVKYCLEDIGCVIKAKKVRKVLKKHHYDELLKLHNNSIFPTLLLYGRYGTQLTFNGANVLPQNLDASLNSDHFNAYKKLVHHIAYQADPDTNGLMGFLVELKEGSEIREDIGNEMRTVLLDGMCEDNRDLKWQIETCRSKGLKLPEMKFFESGKSPIKSDPHRKKEYIYYLLDEQIEMDTCLVVK